MGPRLSGQGLPSREAAAGRATTCLPPSRSWPSEQPKYQAHRESTKAARFITGVRLVCLALCAELVLQDTGPEAVIPLPVNEERIPFADLDLQPVLLLHAKRTDIA